MEFELNLEKEILELERQLQNKTYTPRKFSVFVVTKPKIREVFAAMFRDRVVHHLLAEFLLPVFEPKFIYDSYACRYYKGTHKGVIRLFYFLRKATLDYKKKAYYLQADIKSFFPSINHDILFNLIKKHVKNPDILWLTKVVVYFDCSLNPVKKGQLSLFSKVPFHKSLFNVPKGQGLPIGNLTSQFFANVYLNELDQYVKHTLKCKYYVRYVDDFIILHTDKKYLHQAKEKIREFLNKKLALTLHPQKTKIEKVSRGIDTLGYIIKPTHILVRNRVVKDFKSKLYHFQKVEDFDLDYILSCVNSYYAHFRHANSYNLRKNLYEKHFKKLKKYLRPVDDYNYFKLR